MSAYVVHIAENAGATSTQALTLANHRKGDLLVYVAANYYSSGTPSGPLQYVRNGDVGGSRNIVGWNILDGSEKQVQVTGFSTYSKSGLVILRRPHGFGRPLIVTADATWVASAPVPHGALVLGCFTSGDGSLLGLDHGSLLLTPPSNGNQSAYIAAIHTPSGTVPTYTPIGSTTSRGGVALLVFPPLPGSLDGAAR